MSNQESKDQPSPTSAAPAELTAVVDELLNQLSTKFSSVSSEIMEKMDEMSRRLDNLEATIQAGSQLGGTKGDK
ncbi:heat shock factor-binding protein [Lineolata rhizophorae]|uniref:Heat shock factor-binding protein n=1 Tax=Lineolata rhizophorae TaxID=578093 RepID=A0A6A6NP90_9PEZI|nr:heat shock factor-binding protein [Lineolata rhizophorae]